MAVAEVGASYYEYVCPYCKLVYSSVREDIFTLQKEGAKKRLSILDQLQVALEKTQFSTPKQVHDWYKKNLMILRLFLGHWGFLSFADMFRVPSLEEMQARLRGIQEEVKKEKEYIAEQWSVS